MRTLTPAELANVCGGGKTKATPVGPKKRPRPARAAHGFETATAASNKPKLPHPEDDGDV